MGVEIPWFNANSASYFSAKQMLKKKFRCYYTSLGYAEKDVNKAWQRLFNFKINYFITLIPDMSTELGKTQNSEFTRL